MFLFLVIAVAPISKVGDGMSDLRDSVIIDALRFLLTEFIGMTGPLNINSLMNRFTNSTGSFDLIPVLEYFGLKTPLTISTNLTNGTLDVIFNSIGLSGMNTFNEFSLFVPTSSYILDNHIALDSLGVTLNISLNITSTDGVVHTNGIPVLKTFDFDLLTNDDSIDFELQIASPKGQGNNYTNPMCLNMACLSKMIYPNQTGIYDLTIGTELLNTTLNLDPPLDTNKPLEAEVLQLLSNVRSYLSYSVHGLLNPLLNFAMKNIGNDAINKALSNALMNADDCESLPEYPYDQFDLTSTLAAVCTFIGVTIIILIIVVIMQKRNSCSFFRTDSKASLLMTPKLPLFVRILMPFLIFMNVSLFISSNTGIGASVFIKLNIGDKIVSFPSMFDFGLINSIKEMWVGNAIFLSILIAVMSCIWPYTKLILMTLIWILPTNILSERRRKSFLHMLDVLGKWSLVDSYVMILMLVAFHFAIDIPNISTTVGEQFVANLWVYPAYGFVTLLLATVFSLALSHIIIGIVRHVDDEKDPHEEEKPKSLFQMCDNKFQAIIVPIVMLVALVLVIVGVCLKSFSFDFVGLLGWAMNLLGKPNYNEYSVIDLALDVPSAAEYPNTFNVRFTQALYFLVSILVPMIHIVCSILLWFIPMKYKLMKLLFEIVETIYAWSCLDVFVISIIAAVLEISQFAGFMVGDKCEMIDPIVEMFFSDEDIIHGHEKCFSVITRLLSGSYLLLVAAVFHDAATIAYNRIIRKKLESTIDSGEKELLSANEDDEDKSDIEETSQKSAGEISISEESSSHDKSSSSSSSKESESSS
ncbi:hypothetical protein GPJ56_000502 [Histomonas meleagridis]|uniref:uncharacterized protein n=1 Tax=Histomonas meleagridis TaxID=135588 RepID=UPI00355ABF7F|nr:hypothetical protein GPJ56_000502 [Histomonas meleagridis]KAH0796458.1 hypothetical protein GO595_010351 [Histomonas meleagridis]